MLIMLYNIFFKQPKNKKKSPEGLLLLSGLVIRDRDVFVHILRTPLRIEEDITQTDYRYDITADISDSRDICHPALYKRQDTATTDEGHEDTAGSRGVLTESFGSEVEDSAPHDGGA